MPIASYFCSACGKQGERLEITTADKTEAPPECCGSPMERGCGSVSFGDLTQRGTMVRFSSNKGPVAKNRGARGI